MLTETIIAILVVGALLLYMSQSGKGCNSCEPFCDECTEGFSCGPPNFYNERRPGFIDGHVPGTASLLWAYNDCAAQSHDPVNMQYMNPQYTAQQYAMAPYPAWCTKSGCATNCH